MPDLSLQASHQYWHDYPDSTIYKVIAFMEGVEDWTLDGDPEVEAALAALSKELDDIQKIDLGKMDRRDLFVRIACSIKSSRNLRLLQSIDSVHPGSASRVLMYAEQNSKAANDTPGIFLRRNIVFERLRLLSRVFSEERLSLVTKALEGE